MEDIYILDRNLEIKGIIGTYESILWTDRMREPGIFKAVLPYSEKMNRKLIRGSLLYKTDETEPAVITRKYLKLNRQGQQYIQLQGYMASKYLSYRIIWKRMVMEGTPEEIMRQMVYENVIDPEDPKRKMERIVLGDIATNGGKIKKQVTYDNLQGAVTTLAKLYSLGYRLRLDLNEKVLKFEVYQGEDRTIGSEHPCIFSRDFNNVLTQDYYEDESNYCNVCLVGGTGEGEDRILAPVGDAGGYERREMFYNASGISGEGVAQEEYKEQLRQKGEEKLDTYRVVTSFENKINQKKAMKYSLGDYVTCTDLEWGITLNAQITAIEKGYSKSEESCVITLGNQVLTLVDLIKARE